MLETLRKSWPRSRTRAWGAIVSGAIAWTFADFWGGLLVGVIIFFAIVVYDFVVVKSTEQPSPTLVIAGKVRKLGVFDKMSRRQGNAFVWFCFSIGVITILALGAKVYSEKKTSRQELLEQRQKQFEMATNIDILKKESAPIFQLRAKAQLEMRQAAIEMREQAAYYKANNTEKMEYGPWQIFSDRIDRAVDDAFLVGISVTNIKAICEEIRNSGSFHREVLYDKAAVELERLDKQLDPKSP
jgi:hypothetical protein